MTGIIIIVTSFVIAVIGMLRNNKAKEGERAIGGLSTVGAILILISIAGLIAGVVKEISAYRSSQEIAKRAKEQDQILKDQTQMIKEIRAQVLGVSEQVLDEDTRKKLANIGDRLSGIASVHRQSNFSLSDFSQSNFRNGNFTEANFEGALFKNANLSDADLSEAVINDRTRLPAKQ